jgi:ketosteroid isomerase-like protein
VPSNRDTVEQVLQLWNRGEPLSDEAVSPLVHPDVELDMSTRVFNPATYSGLDGFRQFQAEVHEVWAEFRVEPEKLLDIGDQVVALVRTVGRGRQSGLEIDDRIAMIFSLRDGRLTALRVDPDPRAALESVGLPADAA